MWDGSLLARDGEAIALGDDRGMVRTIFQTESGKVLGAHRVGPEATELIQGLLVAMNLETTEDELVRTIFPHSTLSETTHENILDFYGRAIHI